MESNGTTTPTVGWKTWLLIGACGVALGEAAYKGFLEANATDIPPNWSREEKRIPYQLASLQSRQQLIPGAYTLDFYRALYPTTEETSGEISLSVYLPKEGQLEIWGHTPPLLRQMHGTWMDECQMNTKDPRCRGMKQAGVGVILDRIDDGKIQVVRSGRREYTALSCSSDIPLPPDNPIQVRLQSNKEQTTVTINETQIQCDGGGEGLSQTQPMLRPGLREIQVADIEIGGTPVPSSTQVPRGLTWLVGALGALALALLERWSGAAKRTMIWTSLPFVLSLLLLQANPKAWMEALRASWFPYAWVALLIPLFLGGSLKAAGITIRLTTQKEWPTVFLGTALISALLSSVLIGTAGMSWGAVSLVLLQGAIVWGLRWFGLPLQAACTTVFWGMIGAIGLWYTEPLHWAVLFWGMILLQAISGIVLINANLRRVRHFNWLSLGLSILVLIAFETMLRGTVAGQQWSTLGSTTEQNDMFGWARQANVDFEVFEAGQHTTYPTSGYPVAIPQNRRSRRVVALGGSTTGGAFQNDNLRDFYPALMRKHLGKDWEVLNQGVGGWTTWHIERYVERKQDELQANVLTLYVGHNDLLTPTPLPYRQLFAAWESNRGQKRVGQTLQQLRSYNALRSFLVALRPGDRRVAVPIDHAKENILSVASVFPEAEIVLGSEGVSPDPGPLAGYNAMMQSLAEEHPRITYVPIAERLYRYPAYQVYLDDCHLTAQGHEIVSKMFSDAISAAVNSAN